MKLAGRPAWLRLFMDGAIVMAALLAAIYVLSVEAGASDEPMPVAADAQVETPQTVRSATQRP